MAMLVQARQGREEVLAKILRGRSPLEVFEPSLEYSLRTVVQSLESHPDWVILVWFLAEE